MTAWQALMMPYVRLVKAAVPHMKGKGRIVALMSKSVKEPIDGLLLSNAVRSAIHAVQKSLSLQYSGITFNTVCPGMTDTRRLTELAGARGDADMVKQDWAKQMPLGRLIRPEEVGALVAFLRSREIDSQAAHAPWSIPLPQFEGRVRAALSQLPPDVSSLLEGALVIVTDLPGAEVVAEGVDPRVPVLLDALSEPDQTPRVGRIFIYRRNVERLAPGLFELDAEVVRSLVTEVRATFPETEPGSTPTATQGDLGA